MFQWGYGGEKQAFFKIQDKGFLALGTPAAAAVNTGEMGLRFLFIFFFKERKDTQLSDYRIHNIKISAEKVVINSFGVWLVMEKLHISNE